MSKAFAAAMAKLAVNAQDVSKLVDCSEVIPKAAPPVTKPATYVFFCFVFFISFAYHVLQLPCYQESRRYSEVMLASSVPKLGYRSRCDRDFNSVSPSDPRIPVRLTHWQSIAAIALMAKTTAMVLKDHF